MIHFADYTSRTLGVKLPEDYASFMERYGKKLPDDPVHEESWIGGLGSPDFVIGTTLAFRSTVSHFRNENVVIGYVGIKTIVINMIQEEIDEYLMVDTGNGALLAVDSLGATSKIAPRFKEWIEPELLRAALKEKYASNLIATVFDDENKAEEARLKLLKLEQEGFIELEDAVVVVKEQDSTIRYQPMHRMARKGGIAGSLTGLIVGSILLHPLIGAVLGAVTGAVSASLSEVGIDERFVRELSERFGPGCSALFTLTQKTESDRAAEEFLGFGGRVLVSSLSKETEAALQELLQAPGRNEAKEEA
ncbi:MAG: DUF1269 domain-containing protein [Desulforhabdus sp.]|jgi:uncharacterized membrane protein|nr:DUF1269 domain-containing protein [Desulforhabdus sp.]